MTTSTTVYNHIVSTPDVFDGKPRLAGRRISVQNIAVWHERMGLSVDEIATTYDLTLGEVYAALAYYHDHRLEVDATIQADADTVAALKQRIASRLPQPHRV
ncbi:MAG: DUF433 domain-containing protein [Chloroflexaceae bacterium]|nr:DUF433 domain-containing protein [Chloroflexaceae bacterium]